RACERAVAYLAGAHLRLHVADDQMRGAAVVAQELPHDIVLPTRLLDLDRVELQPLCQRVRCVADAATTGSQRAEVEVMRRRRREADELLFVEHGHDEA